MNCIRWSLVISVSAFSVQRSSYELFPSFLLSVLERMESRESLPVLSGESSV